MRALTSLLVLVALAVPAAAATCPAGAVSLPGLALPAPSWALTIVALGSSSTEGAGAAGPIEAYPARLEAALALALPRMHVRVVNAGRSGQTSAEMLARLDSDVLAFRPDLVIWQAGGNEALRDVSAAEFRAVMESGLTRLAAAGLPVVLMDNQRSPRLLRGGRGPGLDAVLASLGPPVFARSALMRQWEAAGEAELTTSDGLHQNARGYDCLAQALAASLLAATPWQAAAQASHQLP